ncbi:MAG: 50S ribosomal protein L13 [Planctomycetes bacterium]|jgi:large subunit ribosomal protein L13|nr:50S ribosomal protein L13 [Planctomycetota bacterium]
MSKTFLLRKEDVVRRWLHIDARDVILGKLAVHAAVALMGKDCPTYTPGVDSGGFIVVTNAELVKVTGKKEANKKYRWYTGYIGGLKEKSLETMRATKPEKVIQLAVRRMLPKNKLGRNMLKRLKVYAGAEHPHEAQAPQTVTVS